MAKGNGAPALASWDRFLRRQGVSAEEARDRKAALREGVEALTGGGLAPDEAFLVAVRRLAATDPVARRFVRSRSFWKEHLPSGAASERERGESRTEALVVLGLAVAAAVAIKVPELFGIGIEDENAPFYQRNLSLFVLPPLAAYLAWKRRLERRHALVIAGAFLLGGLLVNLYPFEPEGSTFALAALHLPLALWLFVGLAASGGRWKSGRERIRFVRFSGEHFIHFVLLWLGGMVLAGLTGFLFAAIGLDAEGFLVRWLLPCGGVGGFLVAAWLVERKRSLASDLAPLLTRVFTPLFSVVLLAFLGTMAWTGSALNPERDLLIGLDLLLVVVVGLLLYSISARDRERRPGPFDAVSLVLVLAALAVDLLALGAIAGRISEFGLSPNRAAVLGENLILLANLGGSAWLLFGFLRRGVAFSSLERWQTGFLPVYGIWAALVVAVFPPLFSFA